MIRKHLVAIMLTLVVLFCGADGYIITNYFVSQSQPTQTQQVTYARVQTD